jgi:hypothetical protein
LALLQKKTIGYFTGRRGREKIFSENKRVLEFSLVKEAGSKYIFPMVGGSEGMVVVYFHNKRGNRCWSK